MSATKITSEGAEKYNTIYINLKHTILVKEKFLKWVPRAAASGSWSEMYAFGPG